MARWPSAIEPTSFYVHPDSSVSHEPVLSSDIVGYGTAAFGSGDQIQFPREPESTPRVNGFGRTPPHACEGDLRPTHIRSIREAARKAQRAAGSRGTLITGEIE